MTTILTIILLIIILFGSHYNAFLFGYEKGRYDLLKELDEGIKRIQKDNLDKKIAKASESWKGVDVDKFMAEMRGYDLKEENDSD